MTTWTNDELDRIAAADELQLASLRPDGTLRNPVTIWVVRHGDDLDAAEGPDAAWFRGTQVRHEGRIQAGGVAKDVTFADAAITASSARARLLTEASTAATPRASSTPC